MRPPRSQRVKAPVGAPGEVAAQIRMRVVAGGALDPGQIGCHGQPQPVSMRHEMVDTAPARTNGKAPELHHAA